MSLEDEVVLADIEVAGRLLTDSIARDSRFASCDLQDALDAARFSSHPYSASSKEVRDYLSLLFGGDEQAKCAVGLVKTKPGVFIEVIQHLIVLTTSVEVRKHDVLLDLSSSLGPDGGVEGEYNADLDSRAAVSAQARRLLQICLVQQDGVKEIGLSFGHRSELQRQESGSGNIGRASWLKDIFEVSQLIATIPDRGGFDAPTGLQSPLYYESVLRQLLSAGEQRWEEILHRYSSSAELGGDGTFVYIGEVISRLSRRGQADVISTVYVPVLTQHVKQAMAKLGVKSVPEMTEPILQALKLSWENNLWTGIFASIKDSHAMEKLVEALLKEMSAKIESDMVACCILWMIFGSLLSKHNLTRMVFLDKCLFVKILPIRCLRWILEFAVLHKPIASATLERSPEERELLMDTEVVRRLAQVWSSNDFIRSASLPKQAYMTAAVGICVRSMNKEDLDKCGDLMRSILQGVTNRLDSPLPLVREMSKRVALAFSLAINPAKPLLLDDEDQVKDLDNWDYLSLEAVVGSKEEHRTGTAHSNEVALTLAKGDMGSNKPLADAAPTDFGVDSEHRERRRQRRERREKMALEEDDPDAVVNLGQVDSWLAEAEGSAADSSSDIDSDTEGSLQPYDMSDDESELEKRKLPSQLRECAASLRKPDDPDAVEKSLQVAEQLIRAMPVELDNSAEELAQALVHVRSGANAVEGEEEKLENQRHGALVALLVCAPLSSIVIVTQEIFSPHLDISQRLLLLDAIADAAQELAGKLTVQSSGKQPQQGFITEVTGASHRNPWYGPSHHQGPAGAGPWSEVPALMPGNALVGWAQRYEREIPLRKGDRRVGTSRKWAPRSMQLREKRQSHKEFSSTESLGKNLFAPLSFAFMLPIMRDYDKKGHGVDFLESGFIVLGKILYTLGVCMECITAQPEAVVLGANLLELLRSRAVANHPEAYVRRAALYAASRVIVALHPSQVATAITGTDSSITSGLEWVREWALGLANNDPDSDCASLAMACVQLHSEMALQAMRVIQSTPPNSQSRNIVIQASGERSIIMPF
ncbi:hypothetical protein M758_1G220500 [Ceratodon purpureus]|nr:hypothetical protein M758_1G220500 [Ceratodon purpureus]